MSEENEGENNQNDTLTDLDDFEFYFRFIKPLVLELPTEEDRGIGAAWAQKLEQLPDTEEEKEQRLNYVKLLLFVLQRGRLSGIFKKQPPSGPLQPFPQGFSVLDMGNWMLDQDDTQICGGGDAGRVPYEIELSNDLREFAASQEIPNFGVQMYYAWSSEDPVNKWWLFDEEKFPQYILEKIKQLNETKSDDKTVAKNGCIIKKKGCDLTMPEKFSKKKVKSPQEIEKSQGRSYHTYLGLVGQMGNFSEKCDDDPEKYQRQEQRKGKCPKKSGGGNRFPANTGEIEEIAGEEEYDNLVSGLGGLNAQNRPCFCPYSFQQFGPDYQGKGSQPFENPQTPFVLRGNTENIQYAGGKSAPKSLGGQCQERGLAIPLPSTRNAPRQRSTSPNLLNVTCSPEDNQTQRANQSGVCICTNPPCTCPCPRGAEAEQPKPNLASTAGGICNEVSGTYDRASRPEAFGGRKDIGYGPVSSTTPDPCATTPLGSNLTSAPGDRDTASSFRTMNTEVLHCYDYQNPDPGLTKPINKNTQWVPFGQTYKYPDSSFRAAQERMNLIANARANKSDLGSRRVLFDNQPLAQNPCLQPEKDQTSPPLLIDPLCCENSPQENINAECQQQPSQNVQDCGSSVSEAAPQTVTRLTDKPICSNNTENFQKMIDSVRKQRRMRLSRANYLFSQPQTPQHCSPQPQSPQADAQSPRPAQVYTQQAQPTQVCPQQTHHTQVCPQQTQPTQVCPQQTQPTQVCPQQTQPTQVCPQQTQPTQVCPQQTQPTQVCPQQTQPTQVCPQQAQPTQVCPQQTKPTQVCPQQNQHTQVCAQQPQLSQVCPQQAQTAHVCTQQPQSSHVCTPQSQSSHLYTQQPQPAHIYSQQLGPSQMYPQQLQTLHMCPPTQMWPQQAQFTQMYPHSFPPVQILPQTFQPAQMYKPMSLPNQMWPQQSRPAQMWPQQARPAQVLPQQFRPSRFQESPKECPPQSQPPEECPPISQFAEENLIPSGSPKTILINDFKGNSNAFTELFAQEKRNDRTAWFDNAGSQRNFKSPQVTSPESQFSQSSSQSSQSAQINSQQCQPPQSSSQPPQCVQASSRPSQYAQSKSRSPQYVQESSQPLQSAQAISPQSRSPQVTSQPPDYVQASSQQCRSPQATPQPPQYVQASSQPPQSAQAISQQCQTSQATSQPSQYVQTSSQQCQPAQMPPYYSQSGQALAHQECIYSQQSGQQPQRLSPQPGSCQQPKQTLTNLEPCETDADDPAYYGTMDPSPNEPLGGAVSAHGNTNKNYASQWAYTQGFQQRAIMNLPLQNVYPFQYLMGQNCQHPIFSDGWPALIEYIMYQPPPIYYYCPSNVGPARRFGNSEYIEKNLEANPYIEASLCDLGNFQQRLDSTPLYLGHNPAMYTFALPKELD